MVADVYRGGVQNLQMAGTGLQPQVAVAADRVGVNVIGHGLADLQVFLHHSLLRGVRRVDVENEITPRWRDVVVEFNRKL